MTYANKYCLQSYLFATLIFYGDFMTTTNNNDTGRIDCKICGAQVHAIETHLKNDHPDVTLAEYKATYPDAPVLSELAKKKISEAMERNKAQRVVPAGSTVYLKQAINDVFALGNVAGTKNSRGDDVKVSVIGGDRHELVPDIEPEYVYELETLKNVLMAIELNEPLMIWGHTGTGKTTILEQVFARTGRPCIRVQHTVNMEERDITGQMLAKNGETYFGLGPLPMAMKNGWVYIADEYDFALPSVTSVYQAVLEGKPLIIKEADAENRIIRPHPDFRFVATGNTNGTGDETFLYSGTNVQNSANYDRFGVVIEKKYMLPELEVAMIVKKARIEAKDARKIVDFGGRIRESYADGKLSAPISPRTLLRIASIGLAKGNFKAGIELTFSNKLSRIDKEVADGLAQRIFG